MRLIDPDTGKLQKQIVTGQLEVNCVSFSPDGQEVATAGDDGTICVWNLQNGSERLRFKAHPGKAFQLRYTTDGTQLISCGDDPVIRVFDASTGIEAYKLDGHLRKEVHSLLLAHDGKTFFSTGGDHFVRRWDLDQRRQVGAYECSSDIGPVVFDPSRDLLIVGDSAGEVDVVSTRTYQKISTTKHLDRILSLALDPSATLLAVGDASGQLRLSKLNDDG